MYFINSYEIPRTFFSKINCFWIKIAKFRLYYFQYNRSGNFNSGLASFFHGRKNPWKYFRKGKKGVRRNGKNRKKLQAVLVIYVSLYTYDLHILQISQWTKPRFINPAHMVYCSILLPVNRDPVHGGDMLECDIQCPKEVHLECRAELVFAWKRRVCYCPLGNQEIMR